MLAEARVSVPPPILLRPPVPANVPDSVPPAVPVERLAPTPFRLTVPPLVRDSMVSVPPSESVAPAAIVTLEVAERRLLPVVAKVPALTIVAPV